MNIYTFIEQKFDLNNKNALYKSQKNDIINPKAFLLGIFNELNIQEVYLESNILFLLTKSNKIFAINIENFDIKSDSVSFDEQLKSEFKEDQNYDLYLNCFERVYEINIFNDDKAIEPSSIHINKLNNSLLVVYLKTNPNNHSELIFCEISLNEIRNKFELIKNLVSIFYCNNNLKKNQSENLFSEINKNNNYYKGENCKLSKNPLIAYLNFLEKFGISNHNNYNNNRNKFSIEELTLLSLIKCPIKFDSFNKEIFYVFKNFNSEILSLLINYNINPTSDINLNNLLESNSLNINNTNLIQKENESFLEFYNDKYFQILNLFKLNFSYLFQSENFAAPSFIEIDELNSVFITKNPNYQFKVWDSKSYQKLMEISDRRIQEIRMTNEILITLRSDENDQDNLFFEIYKIKTGIFLSTFKLNFSNTEEQVEIIEFFDTKMLIKVSHQRPKLIDLVSGELNFIDESINFTSESMFVYVSHLRKFICINNNEVLFFNLQGKLEKKIKNSNVEKLETEHICITKSKKFMVIYWQKKFNEDKKIETENKIENNKIQNHLIDYLSVDNIQDLKLFSYCNSKNKLISLSKSRSKIKTINYNSDFTSFDKKNNAILDISCFDLSNKLEKVSINRSDNTCFVNDYYLIKSKSSIQLIENNKNLDKQNPLELSSDSVMRNLDYELHYLLKSNEENILLSNPSCYKINKDITKNHFDNSNFLFSRNASKVANNKENFYANELKSDFFNLDNSKDPIRKEIRKSPILGFNEKENYINSFSFDKKKKLMFKGEIQVISMMEGFIDENYYRMTNDNLNHLENISAFYTGKNKADEYEIDIQLIYLDEFTRNLFLIGKKGEIVKMFI